MTAEQRDLPNPIRNRWALLVGINRYSNDFSQLNFCVNDVLALEQVLTQLDYTVVCLHDEIDRDDNRFPTRNNIEAELTKLCQAAGSDDLLWVHFACHGTLMKQKPVLIAQDTRYATLSKTALALREVEDLMRGSHAKRLVITLDACHTGVDIGRDVSDPKFIKNACELAEGFALIAASTAQQVAQEWEAVEHGVFTYYLLEGLTGKADSINKGFITVNDLQTFVVDQLNRWNIKYGKWMQEPTFRADGRGDFILGDYRTIPKPELSLPKPANTSAIDEGSIRFPEASVSQKKTSSQQGAVSQPFPGALSRVQQIKAQSLQQRLNSLTADYDAVSEQRNYTTNAADRVKLDRQLQGIEEDMKKVATELDELGV